MYLESKYSSFWLRQPRCSFQSFCLTILSFPGTGNLLLNSLNQIVPDDNEKQKVFPLSSGLFNKGLYLPLAF